MARIANALRAYGIANRCTAEWMSAGGTISPDRKASPACNGCSFSSSCGEIAPRQGYKALRGQTNLLVISCNFVAFKSSGHHT